MIPKDQLPDCARCGCQAVNHVIPPQNTSMANNCFSCDECAGYARPEDLLLDACRYLASTRPIWEWFEACDILNHLAMQVMCGEYIVGNSFATGGLIARPGEKVFIGASEEGWVACKGCGATMATSFMSLHDCPNKEHNDGD